MAAVGYYIFFIINWFLTLLPLRVLYVFSDIMFFFLYYFPAYRKNVVETNLRNAFPEKSAEELKDIEKKYYRHLSDMFVEVFKLTHMSDKEQKRRFTYSNLEIIDKLREEKRDIVAVLGHYNNWEWPTMLPFYLKYKTLIIYKPLQNKYFDRYIYNHRSKHGIILTPMSLIIREIVKNKENNVNTFSIFLADQTPVRSEIKYWTRFLNQDTPVYIGTEKIAMKYDMAVLYLDIQKIKRGYYNLNIELLFDHTKGLAEHVITDAHVRRLEEIIKEKPEYWLWSHRRWKHKKPVADA